MKIKIEVARDVPSKDCTYITITNHELIVGFFRPAPKLLNLL